jgi:hypothetical protein
MTKIGLSKSETEMKGKYQTKWMEISICMNCSNKTWHIIFRVFAEIAHIMRTNIASRNDSRKNKT